MPIPPTHQTIFTANHHTKSSIYWGNVSSVNNFFIFMAHQPWCWKFECHHWATIKIKLDECGFRPPLCTYKLNWSRITPWGWWDECDDTARQTQDSKFEAWWSEAEHATSRSWRFSTILNHHEWAGKRYFVSSKLEGQSGVWTHDLRLSNAPGPPLVANVSVKCFQFSRIIEV